MLQAAATAPRELASIRDNNKNRVESNPGGELVLIVDEKCRRPFPERPGLALAGFGAIRFLLVLLGVVLVAFGAVSANTCGHRAETSSSPPFPGLS
ncbi:hypothetical protein PVAR5_8350 [Paecilomyces variotii No. 5]|uniref:Uncharacterized protein n=1 Tax=Byssochlamys spectabilis (strain No. 5 / NBRC 109023) TaxID=1356009 RepID=V5G588_BYSSN|nr:hypothetical protein PVAR5_8350 [Paecilomyces variotii No. 5]